MSVKPSLMMTPVTPMAEDVDIRVVAVDDVDAGTDAELCAIVADVFPDVDALKGTWFFQTRPDVVTIARVAGSVVGLRPVVRRTVMIDDGDGVAIAGGIIPTVSPAFRGRGIAKQMTEITLDWITQCGDALSLAFLFGGAPAPFLDRYGYEALHTRFVYSDPDTGADVVETMRAFARPLGQPPRVAMARIRSATQIHLGRGTW